MKDLQRNVKTYRTKKQELETDLHSAKYRPRIEKTKKARLNEIEKEEANKEIQRFKYEAGEECPYIYKKGREEET